MIKKNVHIFRAEKMVRYYTKIANDHKSELEVAMEWLAFVNSSNPARGNAKIIEERISNLISIGGGSALHELQYFIEEWLKQNLENE